MQGLLLHNHAGNHLACLLCAAFLLVLSHLECWTLMEVTLGSMLWSSISGHFNCPDAVCMPAESPPSSPFCRCTAACLHCANRFPGPDCQGLHGQNQAWQASLPCKGLPLLQLLMISNLKIAPFSKHRSQTLSWMNVMVDAK